MLNFGSAPFILDSFGSNHIARTEISTENKTYKLHSAFVPAANSRVFLCRLQIAESFRAGCKQQRASELFARGGGEGGSRSFARPLRVQSQNDDFIRLIDKSKVDNLSSSDFTYFKVGNLSLHDFKKFEVNTPIARLWKLRRRKIECGWPRKLREIESGWLRKLLNRKWRDVRAFEMTSFNFRRGL
jgi:hypothetical protein